METWAGFCMAWFGGTSPGGTVPSAPPLGNVTKDQAPQGLRNLMVHSHLPPSLPCLSPEPLPAQGQPPSAVRRAKPGDKLNERVRRAKPGDKLNERVRRAKPGDKLNERVRLELFCGR